jgi:hypothetical protein
MTTAEQWNKMIGAPIFATRCDLYGLPMNGWSIPTFTSITDEIDRVVTFAIGIFRVGEDRIRDTWCAKRVVDLRDVHDFPSRVDEIKNSLLAELFQFLKIDTATAKAFAPRLEPEKPVPTWTSVYEQLKKASG